MMPQQRPPRLHLLAALAVALMAGAWIGRRLSGHWQCPAGAGRTHQRTAPMAPAAEPDKPYLAPSDCSAYGSVVQAAVNSTHPPQLNQAQLLWIASQVHSQPAPRPGGARFLVFGLGYDSRVWSAINCHGRTAFLENWESWIKLVKKDYPDLEVHKVEYRGSVAEADAFFADPWLMEMPGDIGDSCWDVILVDAPQGYKPEHPGRMEASHFAVQNAKRCIQEGELDSVVVFLHDVNRRVERLIMRHIFPASDPAIQPLGTVLGKFGDLTAYRVGRALAK